jgi:hypothetical protein
MKVEMNLTGLNGVLKTLQSLPPELVSKNGGVVRRAAVKGINVIRNQARINLVRATSNSSSAGNQYGTGFTASKVITKRKNMPNNQNGERYIITVKYENYPNTNNKYKKRPIKANDIAFMLEYGTINQPAEPWLRPAFFSKTQESIAVSEQTLLKEIDKVVNKLAKQNAGLK